LESVKRCSDCIVRSATAAGKSLKKLLSSEFPVQTSRLRTPTLQNSEVKNSALMDSPLPLSPCVAILPKRALCGLHPNKSGGTVDNDEKCPESATHPLARRCGESLLPLPPKVGCTPRSERTALLQG